MFTNSNKNKNNFAAINASFIVHSIPLWVRTHATHYNNESLVVRQRIYVQYFFYAKPICIFYVSFFISFLFPFYFLAIKVVASHLTVAIWRCTYVCIYIHFIYLYNNTCLVWMTFFYCLCCFFFCLFASIIYEFFAIFVRSFKAVFSIW